VGVSFFIHGVPWMTRRGYYQSHGGVSWGLLGDWRGSLLGTPIFHYSMYFLVLVPHGPVVHQVRRPGLSLNDGLVLLRGDKRLVFTPYGVRECCDKHGETIAETQIAHHSDR
jgi:hypothetical protein